MKRVTFWPSEIGASSEIEIDGVIHDAQAACDVLAAVLTDRDRLAGVVERVGTAAHKGQLRGL